MRGLSPVAASRGHSSSQCAGLSLSQPLLLRSTGFRRAGSVVVAHGPSCSAACGILPDQGLNPCPLHWQVDSQPLRHQGSPEAIFCMCLFLSLSHSGVGNDIRNVRSEYIWRWKNSYLKIHSSFSPINFTNFV